MRRAIFVLGIVITALFVLGEQGTNAVNRQFAERFNIDGVTATEGESGTYNFDRAHSFIGFKIKHNGLIEVPGFFRDFTGTVNYNHEDITKSSVEFTAKMESIDTGVAGRDRHLRTADFFEVEKYPEMTFKSTKVEKSGSEWAVTGDLTMKDVTKPVTITFNIAGFLPGGERSGPRMGITGESSINRRDFGVNYGRNLPGTETPMIADNVKIVLQIEALQPKPEPKAVAE